MSRSRVIEGHIWLLRDTDCPECGYPETKALMKLQLPVVPEQAWPVVIECNNKTCYWRSNGEGMHPQKFEDLAALICIRFLKNAAHSFNVPIAEINEMLIECGKRGVDVGSIE